MLLVSVVIIKRALFFNLIYKTADNVVLMIILPFYYTIVTIARVNFFTSLRNQIFNGLNIELTLLATNQLFNDYWVILLNI